MKLEVGGLIQIFGSCFEVVPHSGDIHPTLTSHSTLHSAWLLSHCFEIILFIVTIHMSDIQNQLTLAIQNI